jgi:hypothetical protein
MHRRISPLLLFGIASAFAGCSPAAPTDRPRTKPTPLVDVDGFAAQHRDAARAVAASLAADGDRPDEFYADVEPEQEGQSLVFHLWHESAVELGNRDVVGNPGGKCRAVRYDVRQRRVVQTLFWQ